MAPEVVSNKLGKSMQITVFSALRQFARAIFADRLVGDEFVRAVFAEIGREGTALEPETSPATAFRLLVEKWRRSANAGLNAKPFSDAALIAASGPPPSEARLATLLADIMGFSPAEVETILAPLSKPYADLVAEGRAELAAASGGTALIIEDEPLLAADLSDLLEAMGIKVAGIARTARDGVDLAIKTQPDVILADYNLVGEATGLDAVEEIQDELDCPAIFITGFPDKVLTGENVEPDFVIAKPYAPQAVRAAVAQSLLTQRFEVID